MSRGFWIEARRELWTSGRLLVLLCIALALVGYLVAASYPAVRERIAEAGRRAPAFVQRLIEGRAGNFTPEVHIALAYLHPIVFALVTTWPVARGARAVAGEIERGALGWKLAYPLSRADFLLARAAVMLLGVALLLLSLIAGMHTAFAVLGVKTAGWAPYLWTSAMAFLLYGAVGTLTFWVSAASGRATTPAFAGAGLVVASFVLAFLGNAFEVLERFRPLSIYHYFQHQELLTGALPRWQDAAVLGGLLVFGLVGAWWTFNRRDLTI